MINWRTDPEGIAREVSAGNRSALAQAITAIESSRPDHRQAAHRLLGALDRPQRPAIRVGVSGVPGVGKSTFIEALGQLLTERGHRLGVLAVDPSSTRTKGSVLGDKTRMPQLAANPDAFVRPSPTSGTLGGVAKTTSQAITVLEAAGYDVIIVETVGVGQSETTVASMVDTFLLLGLARTGDQLQGIKKGVLEIADVVAINKADGEHALAAESAARELAGALRMVHSDTGSWKPPVLTCSALTHSDVDKVWAAVLDHRRSLGERGMLTKRHAQQWALTCKLVQSELEDRLALHPGVRAIQASLSAQVHAGTVQAVDAAEQILRTFDGPSAQS